MVRWWDGVMARWRDGEMVGWWDGEMARWRDGGMAGWWDGGKKYGLKSEGTQAIMGGLGLIWGRVIGLLGGVVVATVLGDVVVRKSCLGRSVS